MVTHVIYSTTYGHTAGIAAKIAAALGTEAKLVADAPTAVGDDVVIALCPIYAGKLKDADTVLAHAGEAPSTKVIGVTVGTSSTTDSESLAGRERAASAATPGVLRDRIRWFHVRGGIDFTKLSFAHKMIMGLIKGKIRKEAAAGSEDAQAMIDAYGTTYTIDDSATIERIVAEARSLGA